MIGDTLGHYRVLDRLGSGGMGDVYRAEDTRLKRQVAVKMLPRAMAEDAVRLERFQREAEILAALDHPNIVTIYSVEDVDGVRFLTMQLVDGRPLSDTLRGGALPLEKVLEMAIPLTDAVAAAHERGVVHRDLKPGNVMISAHGGVKVLDFGLAKAGGETPREDDPTQVLGEPLTGEGQTMGTVPYMSPEQLEGRAVDARSDVFAIGVMLYEMAVGERPFKGNSNASIISSIIRDVPPAVNDIDPRLPRHLGRIVERALEKDLRRRYQTMLDLRNELQDLRDELRGSAAQATDRLAATPLGPSPGGLASIAVLPFTNLSGDVEQEFFVDGMTDALITNLAKIGALKVISRTSVMQYKGAHKPLRDIARELGVGAIVEGSVLRAGQRVRITAQLIDAEADRHLWAESYDRDLEDILSLQSDVAKAIASEVHVTLTPREQQQLAPAGPVDPAAHEAYLKGRHLWNKRTEEGLRGCVAHFERAIDIAPSYALAHAGLADAYNILGNFGLLAPADAYLRAKAAALRALDIDPLLGEAHASVGFVKANYDWDWRGAEADYDKAIELAPGYGTVLQWSAYFLASLRRFDEARARIVRAREVDPLSRVINAFVPLIAYFARDYHLAVAEARRALDLDPESATAHLMLGSARLLQGMPEEAIAAGERAVALRPGVTEDLAYLGHTYAVTGRREDARAILDELHELSASRYVSPFDVALVHCGLSDIDEAFEWLERSYAGRAYATVLIGVEPRLDPLRRDPRFADLLRRLDLPG